MSKRHWSDDDFVARIYGVGPEDGHLHECEICRDRWETILRRRESLVSLDVEVPETLLLTQRNAIRNRLEGRRTAFPKVLVPVLVTLLVAVVLVMYRPAERVPPVSKPVSDAELFNDIFETVSETEPTAMQPIRSLFEERK